jgi:hypothetical protein
MPADPFADDSFSLVREWRDAVVAARCDGSAFRSEGAR